METKYVVWFREKKESGGPYRDREFDDPQAAVEFLDSLIQKGWWGLILTINLANHSG